MTQKDIDRFWSHVDKSRDCWIWTAACIADGYGHFGIDGGLELAHRFAYRITYGDIAEGLNICHHCDNPPCVRPDHLYAGTQAENMHDAMAKGRWNPSHPGEANPRAKLTRKEVYRIRELYATAAYSQTELAHRFGIGRSQMSTIVNCKGWKHLAERRITHESITRQGPQPPTPPRAAGDYPPRA